MDDAALRENARAAIDPEGLENLIRFGEAMIERAKELVKAAEAAIHASELLAIEARQTRAERARLAARTLDRQVRGLTLQNVVMSRTQHRT